MQLLTKFGGGALKKTSLTLFMILWVSNSELSEKFLFGVSYVVAMRCQLRLQLSEGSNGLDVQDGICIWQALMPAIG